MESAARMTIKADPANSPADAFLFAAIVIAASVLGACASAPSSPALASAPTPQTNVDYHAIVAADTNRYGLIPGMTATQPTPLNRNAPAYPTAMIPLRLPLVTVHAKVIVDANGKPGEVRITHESAAAPYPDAFDDAVATSVLNWTYTPLHFNRWQDEYDSQGNSIGSHQVVVAAKPFSLDYAFNFALRDGKPVVGTQAMTTK